MSTSEIKIFVCNTPGKRSSLIDDPIYVPMLGGAALNNSNPNNLPGDNTGDNISQKNPTLCELTVQYWAWKNATADYFGFCHYRRYFDFSKKLHKRDPYGNVVETYINDRTIKEYALTGEAPRRIIEGSDIVVTSVVNVFDMPENFVDIEDHFVNDSGFLHAEDLAVLRDVIKDLSPEYLKTYDSYLAGRSGYFCNMFIAKREIFFRYCAWLFPLLEEFENRADMSHYSVQSLRVTGHLAERLLGVFIEYEKKHNHSLRITEVPCILFKHPEAVTTVSMLPTANNVPVVFAANNNFVGPLGVSIKSLLDNASANHFYDIVVLESDITDTNKQRLRSLLVNNNAQLRFVNVLPFLDGYKLIAHAHISKETFFRFVIQDVMPDYKRILYLDCDIVIKSDVAELYNTDVDGYMLAAAHDIDFASQLNGFDKKIPAYAKKKLHLSDPYDYFQAGVLLLNLEEMRKAYSLDEWLTLASEDYKYSDQDVLNRYCQGRVKFLPQEWNLLFDNGFHRVSGVLCYAPKEMLDEYNLAAKAPKIIHYAGFAKPWAYLPADKSDDFWAVARTTPFYEELLYQMCQRVAQNMLNGRMGDHVYWYHSPLRALRVKAKGTSVKAVKAIAQPIIPKGSHRRESVKKFVCKLTGRKYVEPDYRVR